MAKKRYHVVRKQKADTKIILRVLVSGYLLYLAYKLAADASDPSFPPLARFLAAGGLALAAVAFVLYALKEYRAALKEAELTAEEEAELERERNGGGGV